jgi:GR25 family glycosyltransferase involved in LPS biosynthesis
MSLLYDMSTYDYFDDIVCINLDISKDRRQHSEKFFQKLDIPARFFTAKKHKRGGMYGCFDSHIQVIIDAHKRGLNNLLVFEDDFLPTDAYSEEKLKSVIDFMQQNDEWDIFHLGYSFVKDNKDGLATVFGGTYYTPDIVQYNAFCTQALCYSKRAMDKIVSTYSDYMGLMHYDMYISSYLDFKNFCIVPMLFDQNFYFEHNNESTDGIEYILRLLYPVFAVTKLNYRLSYLKYLSNRVYHKYKKYLNYLHLLVFGIILYKVKMSIVTDASKYILEKNITNR